MMIRLVYYGFFCGMALLPLFSTGIWADEPAMPGTATVSEPEEAEGDDGESIRKPVHAKTDDDSLQPISFLKQDVSPLPVVPQPLLAPSTPPSESMTRLFGDRRISRTLLSRRRRLRLRGPATDVVLGSESKFRGSTDAGSLLGKSSTPLSIGTQKRTPIVTDPHIRGSKIGQLLASGSYWFPAREDLDTLLSKIDSRIIDNMIVIKGPYSARYGPGFEFVDIGLLKSPRFDNGPEVHGSSSVDYGSNGKQFYGRQTFWGGDETTGFRVGYGHRTGNDYRSGNGTRLPSSYKSRFLDVALGADLSQDSHIEFNYLRLDQTDVEFAGQIFDIDYLVTDAYELTFVLENRQNVDLVILETWYNQTRFRGSAQRSGKRRQIPLLNQINFFGLTDVENMSTGFSLSGTWGQPGDRQLTLGTDLRYLKQTLNEFDRANTFFPFNVIQNFPIPKAYSANPGLFMEIDLPVSQRIGLHGGGRIDWVDMNADTTVEGTLLFGSADLAEFLGGPGASFDRDFNLGSAFITADILLNDHWTATGGGAFAMRPPTMTSLYANSPFLTVLPQFAGTSPFGNPSLKEEKRYQIDLGLRADYERFRGGINGFYAWVEDYITFDFLLLNAGVPLYGWTNTDWATLAGGELYGEYDVNCWLTAFGNMSYVEGRDHTRRDVNYPFSTAPAVGRSLSASNEEPLAVIAPLEARLGLRWHEPCESRWGAELSARVVDNQDRVAVSLLEQQTPGFTTFDLRGFWNVTNELLLIAGVENFTDKQYREHFDARNFSQVFRPGVNFYFGTELTY